MVFTCTREASAEWHTEPWASVVAGVGVSQDDSVKLKHAEGSGVWQTNVGVLRGETSEVTPTDGGERVALGLLGLGVSCGISIWDFGDFGGVFLGVESRSVGVWRSSAALWSGVCVDARDCRVTLLCERLLLLLLLGED